MMTLPVSPGEEEFERVCWISHTGKPMGDDLHKIIFDVRAR